MAEAKKGRHNNKDKPPEVLGGPAEQKGRTGGQTVGLETIFDSVVELLIIYGTDGVVQRVNRATVATFGFDPVGKSVAELLQQLGLRHPDGRALAIDELPASRALRGEAVAKERIAFTNAFGQKLTIDASATPLHSGGKIVGAIAVWHDVTALEHALEDVSESRRQVLDVLESISDGFFALDNLWRVTYINKRAQELLGLERIDVLFKSLWDKLPNAQVLRLFKELHGAAETKTAASFEELIPSLNKWFEFHIYPYENGTSVYFSDVTERKETEEALREGEERFRTLADNISQLAWMADSKGWIFWYNKRWFEYTGTTLEEMQGWGWMKVHHPEHVDRVVERVSHSWETGEPWEDTFPLRGKDGEYRWFLSRALPIRDERGNVIRWFGTNTDITELRDAQEALQESNRRFDRVLNGISDGFAIIDKDWRYVYVNEKARELTRLSREAMLGRTVWELFPHTVGTNLEKEYRRAAEERVRVTFEFYSEKLGEWREQRIIPFEGGLAIFVRDITEQKRAEEALKERECLSRALNDINATISSTLDFDAIMQEVKVKAAEAIGAEAAIVLLHEGERWVVRYVYGMTEGLVGKGYSDEEVVMTKLIAKSKGTVAVEDAFTDARINNEEMKRLGIRAVLGAPLLTQDGVAGILYLDYRTRPVAYTEAQIDFVTKLAAAVSGALQNARLYEAERQARQKEGERAERLAFLQEVTHIAISSLSPKEVAQRTTESISKRFGISNANIFVVGERGEELLPMSSFGFPIEFWESNPPIRIDSPNETPQVFTTGMPSVVEDVNAASVSAGTREVIRKLGERFGARVESYVIMPLQGREGSIGTINVGWPEPRRFTREEIDYFVSVANEVAIGLENTQLFEAEKAARRKASDELAISSLLLKAADTLSESIELQEVLDRLADILIEVTGRHRVVISLYDKSTNELLVTSSRGRETLPPGMRVKVDQLAFQVRESMVEKRPRVVDYQLPEVPEESKKRAESLNTKLSLSVPLILGSEIVGHIGLDEPGERREFTEREIELIEGIASQAAVVIENARLYETERNIADTLQEALLAMPEHIEGVEYGYLYRSATEATKVGGDFFDIFELEHNRVGIIVGDVSGKGLQAASLTSLVRNTVRAYAYEEASPATVMKKTNDAVRKATPVSYFITLFFGIVDMKSGTISYCSAGHPPALLKRADSVEPLPVYSPVIGAFAGLSYTDGTATIKEGDMLLIYTDGITEARCKGGFYGEERLVAFLEGLQATFAKDAPQVIFDEVMRCTGGELSDDVVLLALSLAPR